MPAPVGGFVGEFIGRLCVRNLWCFGLLGGFHCHHHCAYAPAFSLKTVGLWGAWGSSCDLCWRKGGLDKVTVVPAYCSPFTFGAGGRGKGGSLVARGVTGMPCGNSLAAGLHWLGVGCCSRRQDIRRHAFCCCCCCCCAILCVVRIGLALMC